MHKISKICVKLVLASSALASNIYAIEKINKITIKGNQRIEQSTIRQFLGLKPGDSFSAEVENKAIKSLYDSALFREIDLQFKNGSLEVVIKENPLINHITIDGNTKVSGANLRKIITSKSGRSFSQASFAKDVKAIKAAYKSQGRFIVGVEPMVKDLDNNRVDLIYKITEGPKTKIRKISFAGNNSYSDSELKSVIKTKESAWFRIFGGADTYDMQKLEYDQQHLTQFYNSLGYADFKVISTVADLSSTREYFDITYSIQEGPRYNMGDVKISSDIKGINADDYKSMVTIKEGDRYNLAKLQNISQNIVEKLADSGHNLLTVYPELNQNYDELTVDVNFRVVQGPKAFIDKINVKGNVKTQDKVIRRELRIAEGDAFNRNRINRSEREVHDLGFFENVNITPEPQQDSDKVNLDVEVKEKSTSEASFAVSYQHPSRLSGTLAFHEHNLFGTGKDLDATITRSKHDQNYGLSIFDPYFMDKDIGLGVGGIYSKSLSDSESPYDSKYYGVRVFGQYEISDNWSHEFEYMLKQEKISANTKISKKEQEKIDKITDAAKKAKAKYKAQKSYFVREELGKKVTSSITNTLVYDQRDSRVVPKNGYLVSLDQEIAGIGGDSKFVKHIGRVKYFKSFVDNKFTLGISGELGNITGISGQKVTMNNRFRLGDHTMRGFEAGGMGPRDAISSEGLGGKNYYKITADLSFPIKSPDELAMRGSLWTDVGGLWDIDLKNKNEFLNEMPGLSMKQRLHNSKKPRVTIGVGLQLVTPIGPIRLDYGHPIRKEKYDKTQHFHLRMSTSM